MKRYLVDVAWNHKGTRYDKQAHKDVSASCVSGAISAAMKKVNAEEPDSLRAALGAPIHFTVTMVGQEKT